MKSCFRSLAMITVTLMMLLLYGCGHFAESGTDANDPGSESEKTVIRMVTIGDSAPGESEMIRFLNEYFNVEIQNTYIREDSWYKTLNERFSTGDIPDIMMIMGIDTIYSLYVRGLICEIPEELFKEEAPHYYSIYSDNPKILECGKIGGKLYGLPGFSVNADYRKPLITRKDWLDSIGCDPPKTLNEFEEIIYKFTYQDPDGDGTNNTFGLSSSAFDAVYGAYGYLPQYWCVRNEEITYGAIQPEMKQALAVLRKWYQDGVITPEFVTGENKGGYKGLSQPFVSGQIGVTGQGAYYDWCIYPEYGLQGVNPSEMEKVAPGSSELLVFLDPLTGPSGASGVGQENIITGDFRVMGSPLALEPDKMRTILQILNYGYASKENYVTALYGYENTDWIMDSYGKRVHIPEDGAGAYCAALGNWLINCLPNEYWDETYYAKFAKLNGFDTGGIRDALLTSLPSASKYWAVLEDLERSTYLGIITGEKSLDDFDVFVNEWLKSGGDKLLVEANRWYLISD